MDINKLLHDHQLAKLMAQYSPLRVDRAVNWELAGRFAERITAWRSAGGLSREGWPRDERPCCLAIA